MKTKQTQQLGWLLEKITSASAMTLLLWWIGMAVVCGLLYFLLTEKLPGHGLHVTNDQYVAQTLLESIYFSIITMTTIGYGDIIPMGASRAIVSVQGISGYVLLAIFVTKLVSYRQEIAIAEMHRIAYEDIFRSTRSDLHLVRTDFDVVMDEVDKRGAISDQSFENLSIAYLQGQTLMQEILGFYEGKIYKIEPRHERLLIEAVQRTIDRLEETLTALTAKGIDWLAHARSAEELHELLRTIREVTPEWSARSKYSELSAFEDILSTAKRVHSRMGSTLA